MSQENSEPGQRQTILGLTVFAVLLGIGVAVYIEQFRMSPAVIAFRPTSSDRPVSESISKTPSIDPVSPSKECDPLVALGNIQPEQSLRQINGKEMMRVRTLKYFLSDIHISACRLIREVQESAGSGFLYRRGNESHARRCGRSVAGDILKRLF